MKDKCSKKDESPWELGILHFMAVEADYKQQTYSKQRHSV